MNLVNMKKMIALQVQLRALQQGLNDAMLLADQLGSEAIIELVPKPPKVVEVPKLKWKRSPESIAKAKATMARKKAEKAAEAKS